MRLGEVKLTNYIGIYNGLGINEIYIDFRKCKSNKVFIIGENGSGKSTLNNALHPMPDNNSSFIPGLPAQKDITIIDGMIVYQIKCIHGIKNNGDRDTTKSYIRKISGTESIELNPNGNVSSYKDILEDELGLDQNFLQLSQLGSEQRGLVDMTPSDRKRFSTSIIDSVEVYNNIYKKISKKSSIMKNLMNNIISKINSIGTMEGLTMNLESIENRLNNLNSQKDELVKQIAIRKSKIDLLDPDNTIQNIYQDIYNNINEVNNNISSINAILDDLYNKVGFNSIESNDISSIYKSNKENINNLSVSIQVYENNINSLLLDREKESKDIIIKTEKMNSLQSERNYRDIESLIKSCKKELEDYTSILKDMNLLNVSISKDEFIIGLNCLKDIKETIDNIRGTFTYEVLSKSIEYIKNSSYPSIDEIDLKIQSLTESIQKDELEHQRMQMLMEIESKLLLRPSGCKIDSCNFIKDAIDASKENPKENYKLLENRIIDNKNTLVKLINEKTLMNEIVDTINLLKSILRNINNNINIVNKLSSITNIFTTIDRILDLILEGYDFKEIDELYRFISYANVLDEYKSKKSILHELEVDYKIYQSKNEAIEDIVNDINSINSRINSISDNMEDNRERLIETKTLLQNCVNLESIYNTILSKQNELNELKKIKAELKSKYMNIKDNITTIKESLDEINSLESKLNIVNNEIVPVTNERDKIRHYLILLQDYSTELDIYKAKYEKINTIKEYSSPGSGIQLLFIDMYMGNTLQMANELLGLMFNGEYVLGKYIINEKEFRIPCMGTGIMNDDISSMSTSQKCMISMIISFAMLYHSSTRYNILKIDEIDGGLDTNNRLQFSIVLEKLMGMLNVEQLIAISHNNEMDLSSSDLIILKSTVPIAGNVIYKY